MFGMLENLAKAAIATAAAPIAAAVDVVTLPASAHEGKDAFHRTEAMLGAVGRNITQAITPDKKA